MKKQELIDMLKQAWTEALMDEADIREDLAESYAAWVQGLMKAAAPELSGQAQQQQGQQQQGGQPQGGAQAGAPAPAPAPEGGGGTAPAMQGGMQ